MQISSPVITPRRINRLYHYQENDINILFDKLSTGGKNCRLLYQLATGGGKTVIFSELADRYIKKYGKRVVVLTHRRELCSQTASALKNTGVINKVINSAVKRVAKKDLYTCYVAMVETLKNRIKDGLIDAQNVGLVIVDEAHHNSFHKLLDKFPNASVIGVTATPFSSDVNRPMNGFYQELIVGEPINGLIAQGFLAKPKTYSYEVELNTLTRGIHGDFTVSSSDELYSSPAMLDLLVHAYQEHSSRKKTLIFNNGIFTSRKVLERFEGLGLPIRHLDNKTEPAERVEILKWFKKTKGAILTSVSILTTGFDEPSVQSVILNRATTSLTLYHQMIGRGARRLPNKKIFNIIDLGNNGERFGEWDEPIDWKHVFENPDIYHQQLHRAVGEIHQMPGEMRTAFPNSTGISFDVLGAYQAAVEKGEKAKIVLRDSIRQHALMCADNADTVCQALELAETLDKEITWRIKQYAKCLGTVTRNYVKWLGEDYRSRLKQLIEKVMFKRATMRTAV
ncbi:DEAD/DEAH box helicase [Pedobacter sandarakinus]|uniref:DEAD/DEAH box helicase n=1 Tax=Pedobacter sandarakinus TaxID=353156 RepID=UPI00224540B5|nr:DEAD/DEAH box helicase [Pedobacter sandarakinus]MCX2574084.1 DEAD/DEAH box helicase [Pedobacter sandarakinus]